MKLRLSRRVVPNARVNLNSYWNKFEEFADQNLPLISLEVPSISEIPVNPLILPQLNQMDENPTATDFGN